MDAKRFSTAMIMAAVLTATACAPTPDEPSRDVPAPQPPAPLPEGLPGADELALTPRADLRAELVALAADRETWVATTSTYERVRADFAAIAQAEPSIRFTNDADLDGARAIGIEIEPDTSGDGVVDDDDDTSTTVATIGQLAEAFGGTLVDEFDGQLWRARWPGVLRASFTQAFFLDIDGVRSAFPGEDGTQDGPTIAVESFVVDGDAVYLLLAYGGDCPEGCTELQASRVLVTSTGAVALLETFDSETSSTCPAWLQGRRCPLNG